MHVRYGIIGCMIRPIMTKKFFLRQPSAPATADDAQVVRDLADTLAVHMDGCAGMAANMIGERKRIIAVVDEKGQIIVMLNPQITSAQGEYQAEEGCLSLSGMREARRFERIEVSWQDELMRPRSGAFTGRVAQAIQHEIDHCNGVII